MIDIQSQVDQRGIALDEVGISNIRYPITIETCGQVPQHTIGTVAMAVFLQADRKGTHMSRFVEIIDRHAARITPQTISTVLAELRERLDSPRAWVDIQFPLFLRRRAPVSGATAYLDYNCRLVGRTAADGFEVTLSAAVPVTSVCPCSKAISDYGAHNQRGVLTLEPTLRRGSDGDLPVLWFEDLINLAEAAASSPVYPLIKRDDERYVTMAAYENPVFVEDMVRSVTTALLADARIQRFTVEAINDESIHNHAAFARVGRQGDRRVASGDRDESALTVEALA
jgi:GTP cyclohydrolase I